MNFDTAIKRITWRFDKCPTIWVNNKDIEAFNVIVEFINVKENRVIKDNLPFVKLYAYCLGHFLDKYNTSISDQIPHRELHRLLQRPLSNIISNITSEMNYRLKYQILNNAGCDFNKHPAAISLEEKENLLNNLFEQLKIANNEDIFMGNAWDPKTVEEGIKKQAKNFMNDL